MISVIKSGKEEMKISAEDILLSINKKISKRIVNNKIYVSFENCEIKNGNFFVRLLWHRRYYS